MGLEPLSLERFHAKWEDGRGHNLATSDPEPLVLRELLALALEGDIGRLTNLSLGYAPSCGAPELRWAVAGTYQTLSARDITLTSGAQEAVYLLTTMLVGFGDHAVSVSPGYQLLDERLVAAGCRVTKVRMTHGSRWNLDLGEVVAALRPSTRLVVLNLPHNPTGALPPRDAFEELLTLCHAKGVRVLCDEVFRGTEFGEETRLPAAADVVPSAVSVGDLSKSYGLAGLRVGWVACRDAEVLERVAIGRDYTTMCGSSPSQGLALIALRARERLQTRARSIVRHNLALVEDVFKRHEESVEWIAPAAGTTAFPRLRRGESTIFCERMATEGRLLLAPGTAFGVQGGYFRLGLGRLMGSSGVEALDRALAFAP